MCDSQQSKLTKTCRVCLMAEDGVHLLDWNQPIDSLDYVLSYKECFYKCTQIDPNLEDDASDTEYSETEYLCLYCAKSLKDAHEFIEKAKKSDNELRSRRINKHFEWVTVSENDVEIDNEVDLVVEEISPANTCVNQTINEEEISISDNTDEEDIDITSSNNESYKHYLIEMQKNDSKIEHESNVHIFNDNTKSDNEELMDFIESDHDSLSDKKMKSQTQKGDKRVTSRNSKKDVKILDEMVPCEVCAKVMTRKALRKHKHRHKPKTFLCHACPKAFIDASSLRSHEVIHEENRERIPCEICYESFLSRVTYKKHVLTHHVSRKPMYKCTQPEKSFSKKHSLVTHQLNHEGAKIKCNYCDKQYVRSSDLRNHLETHSGETPFNCYVCGKSFINRLVLKKHMQQHEGFFRYTCVTCGENFSKFDSYYMHRQQHTGFAYKCAICQKKFLNSYRCKRHIRRLHNVIEDKELAYIAVKIDETKEHRARIVEVLEDPKDHFNNSE